MEVYNAMTLWTENLERADRCDVDGHEAELTETEVQVGYVPYEESGGGTAGTT